MTSFTAPPALRMSHALAVGGVLACSAALALTGCAPEPAASAPSPTSAPTAPASATPDVATVAGYDVGQFPPVPLFVLPDLSLLDTSASAFTIEVNQALADIPGVVAAPAQCDAGGSVISGNGTAYLYGDGSGSFTGPDGTVQNFGDGSGNSTINGVAIQNFGDGSGNYSDGTVTIQNFGDGSGNYSDATTTVQIFGDGSGNYARGAVTIQNFGDGSGNYSDGTVTIQNFGDGSGNYSDGRVRIQNWGDGTALVDDLVLDRSARRVWLGTTELSLTPKALTLLEYLMMHPQEVHSRERLLSTLWGFDFATTSRAVDHRIAELRRVLGDGTGEVRFIETAQTMGYQFTAPVVAA